MPGWLQVAWGRPEYATCVMPYTWEHPATGFQVCCHGEGVELESPPRSRDPCGTMFVVKPCKWRVVGSGSSPAISRMRLVLVSCRAAIWIRVTRQGALVVSWDTRGMRPGSACMTIHAQPWKATISASSITRRGTSLRRGVKTRICTWCMHPCRVLMLEWKNCMCRAQRKTEMRLRSWGALTC